MAITYTWKSKKLKEDDFGDATSLVLAMEGSDGETTERSNIVLSFGGDDLKPIDDWTDAEVDAWAEQYRATIENQIAEMFSA